MKAGAKPMYFGGFPCGASPAPSSVIMRRFAALAEATWKRG
jgi:hypothetical protein